MRAVLIHLARRVRDTKFGWYLRKLYHAPAVYGIFSRFFKLHFSFTAIVGMQPTRAKDRGPVPAFSEKELKAAYQGSPAARAAETFVLYRIIGNDLVPRHKKGQSRENLQYLLDYEPDLPDCEKRWVVNRIVDPEEEQAVIALLEARNQLYLHIPYREEAYASCPWDLEGLPYPGYTLTKQFHQLPGDFRQRLFKRLYRHKNNYVINNNGARNAALADGKTRAKWVLPWDGNCFLTPSAWAEITSSVTARPWYPYIIVPMARITDYAALTQPDFRPRADQEPQIIFRSDTRETFNEEYYYSRRPKVELLWRLGVPGPWNDWAIEPWDLPYTHYCPDAGKWLLAGWVARLPSGQSHLEVGNQSETLRLTIRAEAVTRFLLQLDGKILAERNTFSQNSEVGSTDPLLWMGWDVDHLLQALRKKQKTENVRKILKAYHHIPLNLANYPRSDLNPPLREILTILQTRAAIQQFRSDPADGILIDLYTIAIAEQLADYEALSHAFLFLLDRSATAFHTKQAATPKNLHKEPAQQPMVSCHAVIWKTLAWYAERCGCSEWNPAMFPVELTEHPDRTPEAEPASLFPAASIPSSTALSSPAVPALPSRTKPRVVHISTVHRALDPRIRLKQLSTIHQHGFEAHLVTADPQNYPDSDGVIIHQIARKEPGRWRRTFILGPRAIRQALKIPAAIYHIHDPELLPWAWFLLPRRVPVVYDVHEDYSLALHQKADLPPWMRKSGRNLIGKIEQLLSAPFQVVIAEDCYKKRFPQAKTILNYPQLELLQKGDGFNPQSRRLLYTGNITIERGALNLARLVREVPDLEITMAGECKQPIARKLREEVGDAADRLNLIGEGRYIPFAELQALYTEKTWLAGIVLMSDSEHYREKQLTKFFEYMAAGLPIVASDFPAWKKLIQDQGLGFCVDPEDSQSVADVAAWLKSNPEEARAMGERGRELVRTRYSWEKEGERLISHYREYSIKK